MKQSVVIRRVAAGKSHRLVRSRGKSIVQSAGCGMKKVLIVGADLPGNQTVRMVSDDGAGKNDQRAEKREKKQDISKGIFIFRGNQENQFAIHRGSLLRTDFF